MHDAPVVAQQRGFLTPPPNRMLYLPLLLCLLRLLTEPVVRGSAPESSQSKERLQHLLRGLCASKHQKHQRQLHPKMLIGEDSPASDSPLHVIPAPPMCLYSDAN